MKEKIFAFFLENPSKEINIRELARTLKLNHMSVKRYLAELTKEKKLLQTKTSLQYLYKLNKKTTKIEKRLYNLQLITQSGLIEYLDELYETPHAIILFGSTSFGEDIESSDIDIAVQTTLQKKPQLTTFEKKLKRPIELFILTPDAPDNLKMSIYNGIVLSGRIQ